MLARILIAVLTAALVGCQATSDKHMALDVRPLVHPITIGNSPVSNAIVKSESRWVFRQGVNSALVEMTIEGLFSLAHLRDKTEFEIEITKTDLNARDLSTLVSKNDFEKLKGLKNDIEKLRGVRLKARFDAKSNKLDVSGNFPIKSEDKKQAEQMLAMSSKFFLFGKTVTQGEEVFNLDTRELFPNIDGNISGRVFGQSVHNGRPVIAIKGIGRFADSKNAINLDVTDYVDMFTGLSLLSHSSGSATMENGVQVEYAEKQSLEFSGAATLPAPSLTSGTGGPSKSDFPWSSPSQVHNPPQVTPPSLSSTSGISKSDFPWSTPNQTHNPPQAPTPAPSNRSWW